MKITIGLLALCLPFLLCAQNDTSQMSIKWLNGLTWEQVKGKAKAENKSIFLDCYATWCAPCKKMEKEVFTLTSVAALINQNFLSIRVQIDSTKFDPPNIVRWYTDASTIQKRYNVEAFPTFLFFNSRGEIIHKSVGALSETGLITEIKKVLDPEYQYSSLLALYESGQLPQEKLMYVASQAKLLGDNTAADSAARAYINYINTLDENLFSSKTKIDFLISFSPLLKHDDHFVELLYNKGSVFDRIMNREGFSKTVVDYVITKEYIKPQVAYCKQLNKVPNWKKLQKTIRKTFDKDYATRNIINAQIRWYNETNDWPNIIKYNIEKIEKFGLDTTGVNRYFLNNIIFEVIFQHCNDKSKLKKAITWMELILQGASDDPVCIDTYANLLYKVGKVNDAIIWETKAFNLSETSLNPDPIFKETVEKMKRGERTW